MTQATLNVPKALDALENLHGYLLGKDDLYANGALREFCEEALSAISAEDWRGKRHPLSPGDAGMPPRDPTKTNEQQGLYGKFIVRRTDGSDAPGGKHHGCDYFVLDVTHDKHAKAALASYADAVEATHPLLAADMRTRWGLAAGDAGMPVVVYAGFDGWAGKSVAMLVNGYEPLESENLIRQRDAQATIAASERYAGIGKLFMSYYVSLITVGATDGERDVEWETLKMAAQACLSGEAMRSTP